MQLPIHHGHVADIHQRLNAALTQHVQDILNQRTPQRIDVTEKLLHKAVEATRMVLNNELLEFPPVKVRGRFAPKSPLSACEVVFGCNWYVQDWLGLKHIYRSELDLSKNTKQAKTLNPLEGRDQMRVFDQAFFLGYGSINRPIAPFFKEFSTALRHIGTWYSTIYDESGASRINCYQLWKQALQGARLEMNNASSWLAGKFTAPSNMRRLSSAVANLLDHLLDCLDSFDSQIDLHIEAISLFRFIVEEGVKFADRRNIREYIFVKDIDKVMSGLDFYRRDIFDSLFLREIVSIQSLADTIGIEPSQLHAEFRYVTELGITRWLSELYGIGKENGRPLQALFPPTTAVPAIFTAQQELELT